MPGSPVSIGCAVMVTPGASGPPDTGTIVTVFPPVITAAGLPLATTGSLCLMINSVWGVPYPLVIGPLASTGVIVGGRGLVRMGDQIPTPPGMMTILGPPAAPYILDNS
ncbi:hypothetical protein C7B65_06075 [Phormidesmis priestleyi ULC007]|uniref:Uncharacterized protein n=1 Tax=Phormidesmis priestleyi ULC007 TaxID=1920490 RepID=A0A2T1DKD4_9CYAN|nr:hypothetical protein [Phormidesmis priestleyi]PSB20968.1 hypothetical protein C7B65_06075 [Phormidesmis priestleyi ULC007]PZO51923.1 MAG: hypothetical protein DCF14_08220 [Phormidesmis priestleyi]